MPTTRYDQDLATIEQQAEMSGLRMDAGESVYFARQLEYIRPKVYDIKRPKLSALEVFPIDGSVPEWAETVTYTMYDATGIAKIIASYADDLPMVGINGRQFSSKIKSLGDAYGWSTAEVRAAQATGLMLNSRLAVMAKRGHDIAVNKIAWFGDVNANLPGFLSNANIPAYTVPNDGTGTTKTWSTKTPDQIMRDMNAIVNQVYTQSLGIHRATELWLPINQLAYIKNTIRGSNSDATIYKVWTDSNPGVTLRGIVELSAVTIMSGLNVMVAIENSEENLQLILPMAFREYPPQMNNLSWKVPCESRVGGVVIEYPFSMAIGQGI